MNGSTKYVNLNDVVSQYLKTGAYFTGQDYFNACMNNFNSGEEVIITEDIDCEIVTPKQIENGTGHNG